MEFRTFFRGTHVDPNLKKQMLDYSSTFFIYGRTVVRTVRTECAKLDVYRSAKEDSSKRILDSEKISIGLFVYFPYIWARKHAICQNGVCRLRCLYVCKGTFIQNTRIQKTDFGFWISVYFQRANVL